MRVEWSEKAEWHRDIIGDYIYERFGSDSLDAFIQEVEKTISLLVSNPNIGTIDSLFADRPFTYRSVIINGLSKLVYRVDGDDIFIVGFWDTRSEPNAQAAKVKE